MENRVEKAVALHKEGYNYAQAVLVAYADFFDIDNALIMICFRIFHLLLVEVCVKCVVLSLE